MKVCGVCIENDSFVSYDEYPSGDSEEMESVRGMTQRLAARVCEATATTELGNGRFLVAASVGDLEALAGLLAEKKFIE